MESENLLPNDGSYFMPREPVEQEIGRKKERAKTLEAQASLKVIIEHLDKRIDFYNSVDSIPNAVKADPVKFMNMYNANQLTRDNLRSERDYISSLLDTAGVVDV